MDKDERLRAAAPKMYRLIKHFFEIGWIYEEDYEEMYEIIKAVEPYWPTDIDDEEALE